MWPLKFECDGFLTQNASWRGAPVEPKTARHLAQLHAAGSNLAVCLRVPDPNRSEPSREGDARRSVTGPLSAASARDMDTVSAEIVGYLTFGR